MNVSRAAERTWDFSDMPTNQPPKNCFSTVAGEGKPGTWKVLMDDMPLALAPLSPDAAKTSREAVVAQVATDFADNHFPMLILGSETYDDFTFKAKFKIVDGLSERSAGIAFRVQDENNFYYVLADAAANKIGMYAFLKGQHTVLFSQDMNVSKGVWHELSISAEGARFNVSLDGQEALKVIERTFSAGKMGFCTKTDSSAYFGDAHIKYTPHQAFVQSLVQDIMKEYPRLIGLKILMVPPHEKEIKLVASSNQAEIGQPGEKYDADVIARGINYYEKQKETVFVTMPLRDRNGDPIAAVRFVMKGFPGQTEENALVRATPMIKKMQKTASAVESLY